ncbi:MAG: sigma-54 dependent transcriptional regulator [Planctomycetota bacterium]
MRDLPCWHGSGQEKGGGEVTQSTRVPKQILLVADEKTKLRDLRPLIEESCQCSVQVAGDLQQMVEILEWNDIDLVLCDLKLTGFGGEEVARQVRDYDTNIPVIFFTEKSNRQEKLRLLEAGAWDFVTKDFGDQKLGDQKLGDQKLGDQKLGDQKLGDLEALLISIEKAFALLERKRTKSRRIIAKDRQMKKVFSVVKKVAEVPSTVLIQGEPGTGKELIAHEVHQKRNDFLRRQSSAFSEKDHPYLAVNCGALSRTLLESQLFGHKKGSFTGSVSDQDGVFVAARSGTLFLDEITELDLDLQVKLLRAIQEKEVTPVGSTVAVPVKARVVTATNRPIQDLVRDGKFRADLYYRINVVTIEIPPLRDRRSDVQPLAEHFLKEISQEYNCPSRELAPESIQLMEKYSWPGNVRELHNVIERSFALGEDPTHINPADLPLEIRSGGASLDPLSGFQSAIKGIGESVDQPSQSRRALEQRNRNGFTMDKFLTYDELVAEHIRQALVKTRGVKSRAANLLSIDRNRLYRLMAKYQIQREPSESLESK